MRELYPGLKRWTATIPGQFLWPVRREMMMCGGTVHFISFKLLQYIHAITVLQIAKIKYDITIVLAGSGIVSKRNLEWILRQKETVGVIYFDCHISMCSAHIFHYHVRIVINNFIH